MQLGTLPWWAFALLSALFAALTTIFAKLGIQGISSNLATAVRTVVILIIAWAIVLGTGEARGLAGLGGRTWLMLVLSGVATGLSWLCYFRALQLGSASAVAPIDKSSVVMILVLSVIFLGEPLSWKAALGAALVAGGTIVLIL
ncbi:MAG TPA: EamA family transporter [Kouleothrix sp.]|uniref:EamA family transporter n=1 Tax=Kouleothrix sp. TaxID=2779161 RepID=UPI002D15B86D|nr:EamA family transporter [Kouleothrix sp.]HRC77767.1 EamA family transporter [Kouleothrix sp.]